MKIIPILCLTLSFALAAKPAFIKVGEFDIEYEVEGNKKDVVLLEAGGSSAMTDWDPVFHQMAEQATVIRYSRVGNGHSTAIKRNFTSRDYADYAKALLDKLHVTEPVILVAHSYGGSIARDFAAAYPNRLRALLLVEPSSEHDVDIVRAIDLDKGNREIAQIKLDDMKDGMPNQYLDFWSKRPLPDYPQMPNIPLTVITSVKTTDKPTNLFYSDQGRKLWGELWQRWAGAFPQGKSVLTSHSGHYVQFDEPELVLKEFTLLLQRADKTH